MFSFLFYELFACSLNCSCARFQFIKAINCLLILCLVFTAFGSVKSLLQLLFIFTFHKYFSSTWAVLYTRSVGRLFIAAAVKHTSPEKNSRDYYSPLSLLRQSPQVGSFRQEVNCVKTRWIRLSFKTLFFKTVLFIKHTKPQAQSNMQGLKGK